MPNSLVENLWGTELKTFKVFVKSLILALKLHSLVHGLELNPHVEWLQLSLKNFHSIKSDVSVYNLPTV